MRADDKGKSKMEEAVWDRVPQFVKPVFGIDERPASLLECLLYGWQHTLVDISPFVLPLAVAAALRMTPGQEAQLISFGLFSMGAATLLQTTVGNRLPIIQGPSATLAGTLAPVAALAGPGAMWGGVLAGALGEMLVGLSGALRHLRKCFPRPVAGVVILCIGLALGKVAISLSLGDGRPANFAYAAGVMALVFLLQIGASKVFGGILARGAVFFSIWIVGLGVGGLFGDVNWALVQQKPLFELPTLFPYGGPGFGWEFAAAAILGILAGYAGSMVESIGDYAATCAVAGETFTVRHMNRGIFAEGLGCAVASIFGGLPCTSYTQNVGIIASTRVASRFVVQIAAVILALYGICPKFGALLAAIPRPVLGGVFIIVCGMIANSGIQLLSDAGREPVNLLTVGVTLIAAVGVPAYISFSLGPEWLETIPAVLRLLLTNTVALAVILAVSLNLLLQAIVPAPSSD